MTLRVEYDPETGQNHYISDGHVVICGPHITGNVTVPDGTVYSVAPFAIEVSTPEHAADVAHQIGLRFANEGHPAHDANDPFVYEAPEGQAK